MKTRVKEKRKMRLKGLIDRRKKFYNPGRSEAVGREKRKEVQRKGSKSRGSSLDGALFPEKGMTPRSDQEAA